MSKLKMIDKNTGVFIVELADNAVDRDHEAFTTTALREMKQLYIGHTGFMEIDGKMRNPRIFDTWISSDANGISHLFAYARVHVYAHDRNDADALAIQAFLDTHEKCSISCSVLKRTCSICGTNRNKEVCKHKKGKIYGKKLKTQAIYFLEGVTDVYEWAFVEEPWDNEKKEVDNE